MKRNAIANRVFVGYPWKPYRVFWEKILTELHKRCPLHFIAIGRDPGQPAEQLLVKIIDALDKSSMAFFDASQGNPNVSLEYGYARATMGTGSVFMFLDENAKSTTGPGSPIISDLAGTIANKYSLLDERLKNDVEVIAERHPYTRRFDRFCRTRKYKGGTKKFLVRLIRQLDSQDSMLRRELLDTLIHETGKKEAYIDTYLKELHKGGLITIGRGNEHASRIVIS